MPVEFQVKLIRIGDELVLPLPTVVCQDFRWTEGDVMKTVVDEEGAIIKALHQPGSE